MGIMTRQARFGKLVDHHPENSRLIAIDGMTHRGRGTIDTQYPTGPVKLNRNREPPIESNGARPRG